MLSRLLNPKTVAVIGGREAERVIEQCDKIGFNGVIWPVHPTRKTILGRPCYGSIAELPAGPDAAYVAVNREATIDIVKALAGRGAGAAVCYAAGFAEAESEVSGSSGLQARLVEAAGDMPIVGPNCYGFINALDGVALWPDQHGAVPCEKGVAIISQSSNVAINLTMQKRRLPIAHMMTVGNQAQTGLSDLGQAVIEDQRVTALGLHIEGLDDVKAFERLVLRARELHKPIVAIKVGRSEQAQAVALTHTASLAGSDVGHDALFTRLGVARVHSIEAFLETLKLLHAGGPLRGKELLSLSCSGGEASLMADAAQGRAVTWRPFSAEQAGALKSELGEIVTITNPLDYNTFIWGDWPGMVRLFETALAPDFDLSTLVIDFPRADRCQPKDWEDALTSFMKAAVNSGARAAVVASLPEAMPEEIAGELLADGIAPLCGLETAMIAAEAAAFIGKAWSRPLPAPLLPPGMAAESIETLDEAASKKELAAAGLVVPSSAIICDLSETREALSTLSAPFALKALGIAHKTEAGAVKLNLQGEGDIAAAVKSMSGLSDRFLLEEMTPPPLAELIVGVSRDPVCGLLLTIGAGGVLTELLEDSVSMLLPVGERDIREALATLKIGRLLEGYRKTEAADVDALVANIICIANYAVAHADTLQELDVNPLFATQFGSVAVDALIVKRKPS